MPGSGRGEPVEWSNERLETAYFESRSVVTAQRETLADIDEKAMRTVRFTLILGGLVLGIVEYAGLDLDWGLFAVGGGFVLLSVLTGMITYSESNLYLGPNRPYLKQLRTGSVTAERWSNRRLNEYAELVAAHSSSDLYVDTGPEFRGRVRSGDWNARSWQRDLVATYGVWVEENSRIVRRNGWLLTVTEFLLITGVAIGAVAVVF